jgi:hypothetical protein
MRWLVVAAFVLASGAAQASDLLKMFFPGPATVVLTVGRWIYEQNRKDPVYEVTVQGSGWSESEARDQAFKLAVNEAIGSLVLSQSEVINREVARNIVVNYSSGYVSRFRELARETQDNGQVIIRYQVWVQRSTLADGLFGDSRNGGTIDGQQIAQSLRSLQEEQRSGDALLESVLRNFPKRAFDIQNTRASFWLDNQRQPTMWVEFDVVWHRQYLSSLGEAFAQTSQIGVRDSCAHYSVSCSDNTFYARVTHDYRNRNIVEGIYRDQSRWYLIKQHLLDTLPVIRIQLKDASGTTVHDGCYASAQLNPVAAGSLDRYAGGLVEISNPGLITVQGWARSKLNIRVRQKFTADQLDRLDRVDVSVIPRKNCGSPPTLAP